MSEITLGSVAAVACPVLLVRGSVAARIEVFSARGVWYLLGGAVAGAAFVAHLRRTDAPIIPTGALRRTPAWGSLAVIALPSARHIDLRAIGESPARY